MIAQGRIDREHAESLPGYNALTRAVGVMQELVLDSVSHDVCEGDRFLLCSDGLYNEVEPAEISKRLALQDCRESTDSLIEKALQGKARDNITAIVVSVEDDQATKTLFNPSATRLSDMDDDDDKTTVNR
jgi:protein phosphatase